MLLYIVGCLARRENSIITTDDDEKWNAKQKQQQLCCPRSESWRRLESSGVTATDPRRMAALTGLSSPRSFSFSCVFLYTILGWPIDCRFPNQYSRHGSIQSPWKSHMILFLFLANAVIVNVGIVFAGANQRIALVFGTRHDIPLAAGLCLLPLSK